MPGYNNSEMKTTQNRTVAHTHTHTHGVQVAGSHLLAVSYPSISCVSLRWDWERVGTNPSGNHVVACARLRDLTARSTPKSSRTMMKTAEALTRMRARDDPGFASSSGSFPSETCRCLLQQHVSDIDSWCSLVLVVNLCHKRYDVYRRIYHADVLTQNYFSELNSSMLIKIDKLSLRSLYSKYFLISAL